jgi:hypothetical protein
MSRAGRQAGHSAALAAAETAGFDWLEQALELLQAFLSGLVENFTSEDLRTYALAKGFPEPKDERAWGAVFVAAKRRGWIEHQGYAHSANRRAHNRPVSLWRAI